MGYGQVDLAKRRAAGDTFTDEDVFKGVLWAVLSSNNDWAKVERALPELEGQLGSYSPQGYSTRDPEDIDLFIHGPVAHPRDGALPLFFFDFTRRTRRLDAAGDIIS